MSEVYVNEFELFLEWLEEHFEKSDEIGMWLNKHDYQHYEMEEIFDLFKEHMYRLF